MSKEIFKVGDVVRWKRQDYTEIQIVELLRDIEDGYVGPFIIQKIRHDHSRKKLQMVTLCDFKSKEILPQEYSAWWLEKFE